MRPCLRPAETGKGPLSWSHLPTLPGTEGFAGAFAGIVTNGNAGKDYLVVAGGANFPKGRPWEKDKNPEKIYYDLAFKLELGVEGAAWETVEAPLGEEVGYGMSVTLPARGSALFIGGKEKAATDAVWEVTVDKSGALTFAPRVKYPLPIVEGVAGRSGRGDRGRGATNKEEEDSDREEAYMPIQARRRAREGEPLPWPQTGEKDGPGSRVCSCWRAV